MKIEQLPLIDVAYSENKATMIFLDQERGEIREVIFNKDIFDNDNKKFIPDAEKAEKVEAWCQEFFGLDFASLSQAIGTKHDVYAYDRFNSLFEVQQVAKFDKSFVGQIIQTEITHCEDNGKAIIIQFEYDGETYESKMQYADYVESLKEWFVNPQKKAKQFAKFEEKFHRPVSEAATMVGEQAIIEVKLAFSKFVYCEVKPFMKRSNIKIKSSVRTT